jgi:hypothetical protein
MGQRAAHGRGRACGRLNWAGERAGEADTGGVLGGRPIGQRDARGRWKLAWAADWWARPGYKYPLKFQFSSNL